MILRSVQMGSVTLYLPGYSSRTAYHVWNMQELTHQFAAVDDDFAAMSLYTFTS